MRTLVEISWKVQRSSNRQTIKSVNNTHVMNDTSTVETNLIHILDIGIYLPLRMNLKIKFQNNKLTFKVED